MSRAYKGERDSLTIRPPLDVGDEVRVRAARAGMTVSDYGTLVLAAFVGRDDLVPAWFPDGLPGEPQMEIRMTG